MFKKSLAIIISLVFILTIAVGCGSDKASTGTKNEKPIELKMTIPNSPGSDAEKRCIEFKERVETKSEGRITVTLFSGQTLAKGPDMLSAVQNGLADLIWNTATMNPGNLPLTSLTTLPMIDIPTATIGSKALMELIETNEDFKNEYKDFKVLGLQAIGGGSVIGTNSKVIKTLDDLKGMRLRVSPGAQTEFFKAAGAQPMNIPITEIWESMDKKVIDGYVLSFTAVNDYKLWDVTKSFTVCNLYTPTLYLMMNKDKYDSLPEDLQKIIVESGLETNDTMNSWFEEVIASSLKKAQTDLPDTTYILPDDEAQKWSEFAKQSWESWFDIMAKDNIPAKDTTEAFEALIEQYSK